MPQGQSSFQRKNRLQIQRRKHNTDPAQNKRGEKKKRKNRRNMKNKNKTFVGVLGQLVNLKMQGSFNGGDDPYSQRAKSSRN